MQLHLKTHRGKAKTRLSSHSVVSAGEKLKHIWSKFLIIACVPLCLLAGGPSVIMSNVMVNVSKVASNATALIFQRNGTKRSLRHLQNKVGKQHVKMMACCVREDKKKHIF